MTRKDTAIEAFEKGLDCDKAVFSAFEKDVIISPKEDKYIHSCEFPGLPHTKCGAVSGSGCVIFHYKENVGHEDTAEEMWQHFKDEFIRRHGSLKCKELLGYDLSVRRDAIEVVENDVFMKVCSKYIEDAVEILEEILKLS
ncbi:MAG: C_GCAxxG_C_C family protein [Spirochaetales bacterium]|nr:C_GCAxxG_C_C family protein [Spirochaetales bacterium]